MMRRQFQLPQGDGIALDATKLHWESINDCGACWVILHDRPLPAGFNLARTDIALHVPQMYPDSQLDSVWLSPCPRPLKGPPLFRVTENRVDGRSWFRLCRHR